MRNPRGLRSLMLAPLLSPLLACSTAPSDSTGASSTPASTPTPTEVVERLEAGEVFPPGTFNNLNSAGPATIDLSADLGLRPVILYYWIAGNRRAEDVFSKLDELTTELGADRIRLYGVAVPRANLATAPAIRKRVQMMGVRAPVIEDTHFIIGKRVGVERVPHISIIDAQGRLQLTNGASLLQEVTSELSLAALIRTTAQTGRLETRGALGRYFPVKELEGKPSPDFRAPLLADRVEQRWSRMLDDEKLNVLIFWSVDCPHCRTELPQINEWLRQNPEGVNVVSCARALDAAKQAETQAFCDRNGLVFPTLVDGDASVADLFNVTVTPTIVIIGPDGIVDSAIVSHDHTGGGFGATIERKKRELLRDS